MKIEYRHPTLDDLEDMVDVSNRSGRELPLYRDTDAEELKKWFFDEPDYKPEGYLVAHLDGKMVAYGGTTIDSKRQESKYSDAYIGFKVVPEHRDRGIEQHLVNHGLDYLRSRNIRNARFWFSGTGDWRHDVAKEFKARDIRHGYRMIYDGAEEPPEADIPAGYELKSVMVGESTVEEMTEFVDAFNECFVDHWNFSGARLGHFLKFREDEKEHSRIWTLWRGDDIVAVLMCEVDVRYNEHAGEKTGWVNILGVKRPHRRNGIGRALLSTGMHWLREEGMAVLYLGMDAENSKALGLYTSLGYRVDQESITYELEL